MKMNNLIEYNYTRKMEHNFLLILPHEVLANILYRLDLKSINHCVKTYSLIRKKYNSLWIYIFCLTFDDGIIKTLHRTNLSEKYNYYDIYLTIIAYIDLFDRKRIVKNTMLKYFDISFMRSCFNKKDVYPRCSIKNTTEPLIQIYGIEMIDFYKQYGSPGIMSKFIKIIFELAFCFDFKRQYEILIKSGLKINWDSLYPNIISYIIENNPKERLYMSFVKLLKNIKEDNTKWVNYPELVYLSDKIS